MNEIKENYKEYKAIYTDGSCKDEKSAAAAVTGDHFYSEHLPNLAYIFTCELHGFYLAMDHVETSTDSKFVIYSDSKSAIQAVDKKKWLNLMVLKILERYHFLHTHLNKTIIFCWVPSHVRIVGNEATDSAAKSSTNKMSDYYAHSFYRSQTIY